MLKKNIRNFLFIFLIVAFVLFCYSCYDSSNVITSGQGDIITDPVRFINR